MRINISIELDHLRDIASVIINQEDIETLRTQARMNAQDYLSS